MTFKAKTIICPSCQGRYELDVDDPEQRCSHCRARLAFLRCPNCRLLSAFRRKAYANRNRDCPACGYRGLSYEGQDFIPSSSSEYLAEQADPGTPVGPIRFRCSCNQAQVMEGNRFEYRCSSCQAVGIFAGPCPSCSMPRVSTRPESPCYFCRAPDGSAGSEQLSLRQWRQSFDELSTLDQVVNLACPSCAKQMWLTAQSAHIRPTSSDVRTAEFP